jgi:hypothetical protein
MYVCFNDSRNDPTYASIEDVTIVSLPKNANTDNNPCVHSAAKHVPLAPNNLKDLKKIAKVLGFKVSLKGNVLKIEE